MAVLSRYGVGSLVSTYFLPEHGDAGNKPDLRSFHFFGRVTTGTRKEAAPVGRPQSDYQCSWLDRYEIYSGSAVVLSVSNVNFISSVPAPGQSTPPASLVNVEFALGETIAIASPVVSVV